MSLNAIGWITAAAGDNCRGQAVKMTEDELFDLIAKEAIVDRAKLTRDARMADLGVSSIDVVTMLFELEERYGVIIETGDIPQVQTLGEFSDYMIERVNTATA
jgi:acyl carrier protein